MGLIHCRVTHSWNESSAWAHLAFSFLTFVQFAVKIRPDTRAHTNAHNAREVIRLLILFFVIWAVNECTHNGGCCANFLPCGFFQIMLCWLDCDEARLVLKSFLELLQSYLFHNYRFWSRVAGSILQTQSCDLEGFGIVSSLQRQILLNWN